MNEKGRRPGRPSQQLSAEVTIAEPAGTRLQRATVALLQAYEAAMRCLPTAREREVARDILCTRIARDVVAALLEERVA
jgi:hypothetical protein